MFILLYFFICGFFNNTCISLGYVTAGEDK